jgi:SpoVK/Ycf46/Vps4 family AAA+-type ATPase
MASVRGDRALRSRLETQLARLTSEPLDRDDVFLRNSATLARVLGLSPLEREILRLSIVLRLVDGLDALFRDLLHPAFREVCRLAAHALATNERDVLRALRDDGILRRTKLIASVGAEHASVITHMPRLVDVLFSARRSPRSLMRCFAREAPRTSLTLADFAHAGKDVDAVVRLMQGAMRRRARGVNILLHGPPGTGKTELSRVAARAAGATLYEVPHESDAGEADGDGRLAECAIAQRILGRAARTVLVFDEIEDAFAVRWEGDGLVRESSGLKAWTHQMLEEAPVPTVWISNEVRQIDPATLRRFDLIVELRIPPKEVRAKLLRQAVGDSAVDRLFIDQLAADQRLTPAHVARAARAVRLMGRRTRTAATDALAHVLSRNLAVHGAARRPFSLRLACGPYDPTLINASVDLERLGDSLGREKRGSICLYGRPGTGKTAWAQHLAERMGVPLHAARGSDLLDCFVGGTEKNIARLFADASSDGAVVFLDEADSFLQDRAGATRSWEVTQVNELLVQMEAFDGVFICATNLIDSLDRASLRRFAMKVEFRPLRPQARWAMFCRLAPGSDDDREAQAGVARLDGLTPGDFAAVARQVRLAGAADVGSLLAMLRTELLIRKDPTARQVGFCT